MDVVLLDAETPALVVDLNDGDFNPRHFIFEVPQ
jgi:hypothetical protein